MHDPGGASPSPRLAPGVEAASAHPTSPIYNGYAGFILSSPTIPSMHPRIIKGTREKRDLLLGYDRLSAKAQSAHILHSQRAHDIQYLNKYN
ncbi:hypothetical protein QJS04_geneDACA006021 [Acorus gramineus]|uniref:Uncharacterized protein n=1 Tax=Acorus gramineus TaxID=55184 RepID=A0AAV9B034_ACOGR|nr:hypothetical protein QJS04_geneDACA006021 [Acorus gramineus]